MGNGRCNCRLPNFNERHEALKHNYASAALKHRAQAAATAPPAASAGASGANKTGYASAERHQLQAMGARPPWPLSYNQPLRSLPDSWQKLVERSRKTRSTPNACVIKRLL